MSAASTSDLPKVYQYRDFAAYLAAYIEARRRLQGWFSARWIARRAGLGSAAQLSMVMGRKRAPTLNLVEAVALALDLGMDEVRFAVLQTERELDRSPILTGLVERELVALVAKNGWIQKRAPQPDRVSPRLSEVLIVSSRAELS